MAGEIGVHYLEQFAPAVLDCAWLLLSAGRQCLLHLRSEAVIIVENPILHSSQLPGNGLAMRHTSLTARKDTHVQSGRSGTIAHQRPRMAGRKADLHTPALQLSPCSKKICLVSQSRHLLPSSRSAESAKRNAQSGWLPIVADKGRPIQEGWKQYEGT